MTACRVRVDASAEAVADGLLAALLGLPVARPPTSRATDVGSSGFGRERRYLLVFVLLGTSFRDRTRTAAMAVSIVERESSRHGQG